MKTLNLAIGVILLIIGAFYSLMPHSVHMTSGLGFGLVHTTHLIVGVIAIIISAVVLLAGRNQ